MKIHREKLRRRKNEKLGVLIFLLRPTAAELYSEAGPKMESGSGITIRALGTHLTVSDQAQPYRSSLVQNPSSNPLGSALDLSSISTYTFRCFRKKS